VKDTQKWISPRPIVISVPLTDLTVVGCTEPLLS
jgi:hypothetical protein